MVLMVYYDVVLVDESDVWSYLLFVGVIVDGFVYGCGVLDDKGLLIVVFEVVENFLVDGFILSCDVYLLFGGNEEIYGKVVEEIVYVLCDCGIVLWFVVDEGGVVVDVFFLFVLGCVVMIGVGEKGVLMVWFFVCGEGGYVFVLFLFIVVCCIVRVVDCFGFGIFCFCVLCVIFWMLL